MCICGLTGAANFATMGPCGSIYMVTQFARTSVGPCVCALFGSVNVPFSPVILWRVCICGGLSVFFWYGVFLYVFVCFCYVVFLCLFVCLFVYVSLG